MGAQCGGGGGSVCPINWRQSAPLGSTWACPNRGHTGRRYTSCFLFCLHPYSIQLGKPPPSSVTSSPTYDITRKVVKRTQAREAREFQYLALAVTDLVQRANKPLKRWPVVEIMADGNHRLFRTPTRVHRFREVGTGNTSKYQRGCRGLLRAFTMTCGEVVRLAMEP